MQRPSTSIPPLLLGALLSLPACGGDAPSDRAPRAMFDAPAADLVPPPPPLELPEDAPTVAFLGDSIGAGLHLAEHQAFPAIAQRQLFERGVPFRLVNASESGRTSSGGLSALPWVLRSEPDVLVVELGGNDGLRGIPPELTESNLQTIIERARAAGSRVLLLGVRLPTNYGPAAEEFDAIYPRLAEANGVAFRPFFMEGVGAVPELNLPDGLHPTAEGHVKLADNIGDALASVLADL